jgi:hypothetical protein
MSSDGAVVGDQAALESPAREISAPAPVGSALTYRPSGRVAWVHFLPLAAVALIAAGMLAWFMGRLEWTAYMIVITPTVLCVPLLGALLLAIYAGRCRNVLVAGALAAIMMCIFYAGFWLLSYYNNVMLSGPGVAQQIEEAIGVRGLTGYFLMRCRTDGPPGQSFEGSTRAMIINLILRGMEFGIVLAAGLYLARRMAKRAYFEDYGRWASSCSFGFPSQHLQTVLNSVQRQDWTLLRDLEKGTITREQRLRGYIAFRTEYLPRSTDQPVYVTVEGILLPRPIVVILPFLARWMRRWISQRTVLPESAQQLKQYLGGLDLGDAARSVTENASNASGGIGYWSSDHAIEGQARSTPFRSMLAEIGLTGETLVGRGDDFRTAAAMASYELFARYPQLSPDAAEVSFCYPAEAEPVPRLKRLSRFDAALVFSFFGGAMASVVGTLVGPALMGVNMWLSVIVTGISLLLMGLGILCFLFQLLLFPRITTWLLLGYFARRPGNLIDAQRARLPRKLIRIEDPATFHISKITPEDWGICVLDAQHRRLIIEGISHRYLIRGVDVTQLKPVQSSMSVVVQINYRIGEHTFGIALNRYGMGGAMITAFAQQPIIGALIRLVAGSPSKRFARRVGKILQVEVA